MSDSELEDYYEVRSRGHQRHRLSASRTSRYLSVEEKGNGTAFWSENTRGTVEIRTKNQ